MPMKYCMECGAALELIREGENGFIVPADESDALTSRVRFLLENDGICECYGRESLRVIGDYTIEHMAETHVWLLQNT